MVNIHEGAQSLELCLLMVWIQAVQSRFTPVWRTWSFQQAPSCVSVSVSVSSACVCICVCVCLLWLSNQAWPPHLLRAHTQRPLLLQPVMITNVWLSSSHTAAAAETSQSTANLCCFTFNIPQKKKKVWMTGEAGWSHRWSVFYLSNLTWMDETRQI